jgi:hypothetical protein
MPAFCEESAPQKGDGYEAPDTRLVLMVDETPGVGFLPNRKSWARGAPSFYDFGVGTQIGTNPLEKVKDQGFNGIGHRRLGVVGRVQARQNDSRATNSTSICPA